MIHDFLNKLPNIPLAIGILVLAALIGAGMVWLAGRLLDQKMLRAHNDLTGFIYQMVGVVYAVMMAFAVFIVWEQFDSTKTAVEQEANALVSLYDIAHALPGDASANLKYDVMNYTRAVTGDEWNQMALGRSSDASGIALIQMTRFEREFYPQTDRDAVLYDHAVEHIGNLNSFRRLRLQASRGQIPQPMWVLLIGGGLFTVGFTALLGAENVRLHTILTAALAAGLGFTLFIILALDTPYTGSFRITPDPFQNALTVFERNP
jgi:hypothetical protein